METMIIQLMGREYQVSVKPEERETLRAAGFGFYDWELAGPDAARFLVRWDQDMNANRALAAAIARL